MQAESRMIRDYHECVGTGSFCSLESRLEMDSGGSWTAAWMCWTPPKHALKNGKDCNFISCLFTTIERTKPKTTEEWATRRNSVPVCLQQGPDCSDAGLRCAWSPECWDSHGTASSEEPTLLSDGKASRHREERRAVWRAGRSQWRRWPWCGQGVIPVNRISGIWSNLCTWARRVFQSHLGNCPSKQARWVDVCPTSKKHQLFPGSCFTCCSGETLEDSGHSSSLCFGRSRGRREAQNEGTILQTSHSWLDIATFLDASERDVPYKWPFPLLFVGTWTWVQTFVASWARPSPDPEAS